MKTLSGKTAVVTGAALGMGREIAALLLDSGTRVALVDVDPEALDKARRFLSPRGECHAFVCDIADRHQVKDLAIAVEQQLGPVNILVNNAGIVRAAPLSALEDEAIEAMIRVNLMALFWTCKAFLPDMRQSGSGHIVNMASAGGLLAIPSLTAYCASKFGVVGFSDALRQELKKEKLPIGVTCVCPNTVNTGMFAGSRAVRGTRLLSPEMVAEKTVQAIRRNQPLVGIPAVPVKWVTPLLKALLPVSAMDRLNQLLGIWDINDGWRGRAACRARSRDQQDGAG